MISFSVIHEGNIIQVVDMTIDRSFYIDPMNPLCNRGELEVHVSGITEEMRPLHKNSWFIESIKSNLTIKGFQYADEIWPIRDSENVIIFEVEFDFFEEFDNFCINQKNSESDENSLDSIDLLRDIVNTYNRGTLDQLRQAIIQAEDYLIDHGQK